MQSVPARFGVARRAARRRPSCHVVTFALFVWFGAAGRAAAGCGGSGWCSPRPRSSTSTRSCGRRPVPGQPGLLHRQRLRRHRAVRASRWSTWCVRLGGPALATRRADAHARGSSGSPAPRGTPYAAAVLRGLLDAGEAVDLVVSRAARLTLLDETGHRRSGTRTGATTSAAWLGSGDLGRGRRRATGRPATSAAGPSSAARTRPRAWWWCRRSTAACAGIALGLSKDLLQRAAEVTLKERRRLVVVPRETPVTRSHLRAPARAARRGRGGAAGQPGASTHGAAQRRRQLVDFVAGKVLDAARRRSTTCSAAGRGELGAAGQSGRTRTEHAPTPGCVDRGAVGRSVA